MIAVPVLIHVRAQHDSVNEIERNGSQRLGSAGHDSLRNPSTIHAFKRPLLRTVPDEFLQCKGGNSMSVKDATEIRVGNVLKVDGAVSKVIAQEIRGTGKFGKTVHLKLKSLTDGRFIEKSYRAEERVDAIDVHFVKLQYLYRDGAAFYFMNNQTYEQFPLPVKAIGKQEILLKENMEVNAICMDEGRPVSLEFPRQVELKVVSTPPGVKGQTDTTYKEAELENGLKVLVPQFVKEGETIRLNTDDFSYLERVTTKSMKTGAEVPPPGHEKAS